MSNYFILKKCCFFFCSSKSLLKFQWASGLQKKPPIFVYLSFLPVKIYFSCAQGRSNIWGNEKTWRKKVDLLISGFLRKKIEKEVPKRNNLRKNIVRKKNRFEILKLALQGERERLACKYFFFFFLRDEQTNYLLAQMCVETWQKPPRDDEKAKEEIVSGIIKNDTCYI